MSGDGELRVGLVGCGRIAQAHLEACAATPGVRITGVADLREPAAAAAAEQYGCPAFTEPAGLEGRVDAVVVCTPPSTHHALARRFLELGVHVLCEKPLTIRSDHAEDLVELARRHGVQLMMASKFRYVDDVVRAKAVVQSGILGRIVLLENTFCGKVAMRDRWNARRDVSGGGVLIDNGTHSVDIVRYLLGPVARIQAEVGLSSQDLEVEDTVRIQVRTESDVMACMDLSWSIDKDQPSYISIFGSEGSLHVGWRGSRYRQDGSSHWVKFGHGYDKAAAFAAQIRNFAACIRGQEPPLIAPQDAIASVRVIEAAYESANQDNWVDIRSA